MPSVITWRKSCFRDCTKNAGTCVSISSTSNLRWGITQQVAEQGLALEECLRQIDNARPFFVCLLGERYGWIPAPLPPDRDYFVSAATEVNQRSITHLEIEHAVFAPIRKKNGEPLPRSRSALFYFRKRSSIPPGSQLPDLSAQSRGNHASTFFESTAAGQAAVLNLKEEIRQAHGVGVVEYEGHWDAQAANPEDSGLVGRLTRLEEFGKKVEAGLWGAIAREFPDRVTASQARRDRVPLELFAHQAVNESQVQTHVARPVLETEIARYIADDDQRPLSLVGPEGSGKTALLAHWVRERQRRDPDRRHLIRFVGASSQSVSLAGLLASVCNELLTSFAIRESVAENPLLNPRPTPRLTPPLPLDRAVRLWLDVLRQVGKQCSIVLVLDGIDHLERLSYLDGAWLPSVLPAGVKLIVSSGDDSEMASLASRRTFRSLAVPPLSDDERLGFIKEVPALYARCLDDHQTAQLLANPATRSPLYLSVALSELRLFGSFDGLTTRIANLPKAGDTTRAQTAVALETLFTQMLDRLEADAARAVRPLAETTGRDLVAAVLSWMSVSTQGLSMEEIEVLIKRWQSDGEDTALAGAARTLVKQLDPFLLRRPSSEDAIASSLYSPAHGVFRRVVFQRYLGHSVVSAAVQRTVRGLQLADYFEFQPSLTTLPIALEPDTYPDGTVIPNIRKLSELPEIYRTLREASRLAALLSDVDIAETAWRSSLVNALVVECEHALEFLARQPEHAFQNAEPTFRERVGEAMTRALDRRAHSTSVSDTASETPSKDRALDLVRRWQLFLREHLLPFPQFRLRRGFVRQQAVNCGLSGGDEQAPQNHRVNGPAGLLLNCWDYVTPAARGTGAVLTAWGDPKGMTDVAITADGRLICVAGPLDITTFEVVSGRQLMNFSVGGSILSCFDVSGDGEFMVAGIGWGVVVGHPVRLEETKVLEGHRAPVAAMRVARGCAVAASGSEDGAVIAWDLRAHKAIAVLTGHTAAIVGIDISDDGTRVASTDADGATAVWDVPTGRQLAAWGHVDAATTASFDFAMSAVSALYSIGTPEPKPGPRAIALDPAQRRVVTIHSADKGNRPTLDSLWRVVGLSSDGTVTAVANAQATSMLAFARWQGALDSRITIQLGDDVRLLDGHCGTVKSLAFSGDGTRLASIGLDGLARVWATDSARMPASVGLDASSPLIALAPWPEMDMLAGLTEEGSLVAGHVGADLKTIASSPHWANASIWPSTGAALLVIAKDGAVDRFVQGPGSNHVDRVVDLGDCNPRVATITADGVRLIVGTSERRLASVDLSDGRVCHMGEPVVFRYPDSDVTLHPQSIEASADGRFYVANFGGSVRVVDGFSNVTMCRFERGLLSHSTAALGIDNLTLAHCWDDAGLKIGTTCSSWEVDRVSIGNERCMDRTARGERVEVCDFRWCPDGRTMVVSYRDGFTRRWDVPNDRVLWESTLETDVRFATVPSAGNVLVAYSPRVARVLNLDNGSTLAAVGTPFLITACFVQGNRVVVRGRGGNAVAYDMRNIELSPPVVTAVRMWRHKLGRWDRKFTVRCGHCGWHTTLTNRDVRVLQLFAEGVGPDQAPSFAIPLEAWDDSRLVSSCPRCNGPFRLNPFMVDNQQRFRRLDGH